MFKDFCFANRYDSHSKDVNIVLVGKYTRLEDAYTSVIKSLKHASLMCTHRLTLTCVEADDLEEETLRKKPSKYFEAWKFLSQADGVIVPGGFGTRGTEGKVSAAKYARERKLPYLGECRKKLCKYMYVCIWHCLLHRKCVLYKCSSKLFCSAQFYLNYFLKFGHSCVCHKL